MKKICLLLVGALISSTTMADTIGKYAGIAKSIPSARLKADPKSQAWARSAQSILEITEETVAQTIEATQNIAVRNHSPLFCLPKGQKVDNQLVHSILDQAATNISNIDHNTSISEVVVSQLSSHYPCQGRQKASSNTMQPPLPQQENIMFGRNDYRIQSGRR